MDIHTLFDCRYLAVDPAYRLPVSPRLRQAFQNGDLFSPRAGQVIDLPDQRADQPNRDFLEWRLDEVFKASFGPAGGAAPLIDHSLPGPPGLGRTCRIRAETG